MTQVFIKPAECIYTSLYGMRSGSMHYDVDIANSSSNVPVHASVAGVINKAVGGCSNNGSIGNTCNGGYGNYVIVRHNIDGKTYDTLYAHLQSISVSVGQTVSQGDKIGVMGNSGSSTGQHVHFEIYEKARVSQSEAVDPMPYLNGDKPTLTTILMMELGQRLQLLRKQMCSKMLDMKLSVNLKLADDTKCMVKENMQLMELYSIM
ncbi:M23 family metallopeptidase [Lysinibacillus xylanilyticus]|uniref:M23 family metallopeptidase n=1 Tax=Lysinibacillus xylanilyticus TaxID=582475 RepID=UPI003824C0E9